jgi:oligo-1,6-glucosidase
MTNIRFNKIEDYRDIETINMYKYLQSKKEDLERFLKDQQTSARDNGRTPFQWDASINAGFTTGKPWLKINDNYTTLNETAASSNDRSILQFFRQMVLLRKHAPALVYGTYDLYDEKHPQVYTYTRTLDKEMLLIVLNFSKEKIDYDLPFQLATDIEPLVNNMLTFNLKTLEPYQALIFGPLPPSKILSRRAERVLKTKQGNTSLESSEVVS